MFSKIKFLRFNVFAAISLLLLSSCKTEAAKSPTVKVNDTIFIQRDKELGIRQSIYFDENKNSKKYDLLVNFSFDEFDADVFQNSLQELKKQNVKLVKRNPVIPGKKWIPLQLYKGEFYVYKPCDFYTFYQISINDSLLIDFTGEGPLPSNIVSQKKVSEKRYEFELGPNGKRKLSVDVLDVDKGIAIFTDSEPTWGTGQWLMVDVNKIRQFPLIVNNCETHKQNELLFDDIDFEKLKKQYKGK